MGRRDVAAILIIGLLLCWINPALAQSGNDTASQAGGQENLIVHIVKSAGPIFGGLLLILSISLVALIVMLARDLRMENAIPPKLVALFTETVNQRRFKEAFDLVKNDTSFLGRVLTSGMARLQYGLDDAREAAMNAVDSIKSNKDQLNNYVAVISSLGPLIGLVGTVFGMILSFKELARGGKVDAARLAGGISHALVITMLGIGIAVPGVFFNAFFRNRITRISNDTANLADDLLTQMYHNSKKPGVGVPVAVPAPEDEPSVPT